MFTNCSTAVFFEAQPALRNASVYVAALFTALGNTTLVQPVTILPALYQFSVPFTANNPAGTRTTCALSVQVVDHTLPSIVCPAPLSYTLQLGQASFNSLCSMQASNSTFALLSGSSCGTGGAVSDSFQLASVVRAPSNGTSFEPGTTNVTYTVSDAAGNTQSCTTTITVVDNEPPRVVCPAAAVVAESPTALLTPVTLCFSAADNAALATMSVADAGTSVSYFSQRFSQPASQTLNGTSVASVATPILTPTGRVLNATACINFSLTSASTTTVSITATDSSGYAVNCTTSMTVQSSATSAALSSALDSLSGSSANASVVASVTQTLLNLTQSVGSLNTADITRSVLVVSVLVTQSTINASSVFTILDQLCSLPPSQAQASEANDGGTTLMRSAVARFADNAAAANQTVRSPEPSLLTCLFNVRTMTSR